MNIKGRDIAIFVLVVVGVLFVGLIILSLLSLAGGLGGWMMVSPHMMGPRELGPGITGTRAVGWAAFLWPLFICLVPLGLIFLLVVGAIWLASSRSRRPRQPTDAQQCPNCGREVQPDWATCPYCSAPLKEKEPT
jgi:uncharacterized protein (DUF2062 family)